jgi:predicted peroxiredoxin
MDLINELGNELALTFLVEKKFTEKIESSDVPSLIDKIKNILETADHSPVKMVKSISQ